MSTLFSYQEIQRHRILRDCWLIANGKVYNATPFLKQHPEHQERIMKKAGQDVTDDFDFHQNNQQQEWKKYKIGKLRNYKNPNAPFCNIM